MVRMRAGLAVIALFALLLAGCLGGGDDVDTEGEDTIARPTEETGSVVGQVFDLDLNPVGQATVTVVAGTEAVKAATSRPDGNYVLNDIPPGQYRLQVSHIQFHEQIAQIVVEANQETRRSFQLAPFDPLELREPYSLTDDYVGIIRCQWSTPDLNDNIPYNNYTQLCPQIGPNHPEVTIDAGTGLRTVSAAMRWDASGQMMSSDMQFSVRHPGSGYAYAYEVGASPIVFRVDNDAINNENRRFDAYDETGLFLQLYAQAPPGSVIYEQTVHFFWALHYWQEAPQGYVVLPDV